MGRLGQRRPTPRLGVAYLPAVFSVTRPTSTQTCQRECSWDSGPPWYASVVSNLVQKIISHINEALRNRWARIQLTKLHAVGIPPRRLHEKTNGFFRRAIIVGERVGVYGTHTSHGTPQVPRRLGHDRIYDEFPEDPLRWGCCIHDYGRDVRRQSALPELHEFAAVQDCVCVLRMDSH